MSATEEGTSMRSHIPSLVLAAVLLLGPALPAADGAPTLKVVTTLPDYADLARRIGGDRVSVEAIVRGDQDAHFIRPKPSFVNMVREADILIDTGLDLETWVPTVVDKSGNRRVRSGQPGYVAFAHGLHLLEKPKVMSRAEGGLHVYGNPHITCSPVNLRRGVRNIAAGLIRNDPAGRAVYEENLARLEEEIDRRLFGEELVGLLGGKTMCDLAEKDRLIPFLEQQRYEGRPLLDRLGGWYRRMMPLRGIELVTYHKNWVYFLHLFGLEEVGTVEPKPGIPPSTRHVTEIIDLMQSRRVPVILAANYFDAEKVRGVAAKVGAAPVIVPLYVGGAPGAGDVFELFDLWVDALLKATQPESSGTAPPGDAERRK
jgi:zinc/manganese transport system substrate-binding protein